MEPAHNTNTILCPNSTVRLSVSLVSLIQRIKHIEWKMMFAVNKVKITMQKVNR
jgi:hypothetical protein